MQSSVTLFFCFFSATSSNKSTTGLPRTFQSIPCIIIHFTRHRRNDWTCAINLHFSNVLLIFFEHFCHFQADIDIEIEQRVKIRALRKYFSCIWYLQMSLELSQRLDEFHQGYPRELQNNLPYY